MFGKQNFYIIVIIVECVVVNDKNFYIFRMLEDIAIENGFLSFSYILII